MSNNSLEKISPVKIKGNMTKSSVNGKIKGNMTKSSVSGKIKGNMTKSSVSGNISRLSKEEPVPKYEGDYTVLPLAFQDTVLLTKDKKMTENVIIKEIPYYETSNLSGGTTVYIAGQVDFE